MAKSGKHKKLRRQEKAKTQLKGKKLLGKAQNVIEPKLQTKKILIREQLKDGIEGETSTRRKQSFQDVISALNHHNTNFKVDALQGLHELITGESNVLEINLGKIIEKVASLASDPEAEVRKENLKVARALFSQVPEDQLLPFWNVVLSRLRCTLTDLNPSIRQGCLPLISLLMEYTPGLVEMSKSVIILALLKLVSTAASSGKSKTPQIVRVKTDIADKSTDIQQRIKILHLITSCLSLHQDEDTAATNVSRSLSWDEECQKADISQDSPFQMIYPFGYSDDACVSSCSDIRTMTTVNVETGNDADAGTSAGDEREGFVLEFMRTCLPILIETWVEVAPSVVPLKTANLAKGKKRQLEMEENVHGTSYINKLAVEVLECITDLMGTTIRLCENIQGSEAAYSDDINATDSRKARRNSIKAEKFDNPVMRKFNKSFGQDLQKYFFTSLPFSCAQENLQPTMITINLSIFHAAAALKMMDKDTTEKFEKYVRGVMSKGNFDPDHIRLALEIMKSLRNPGIGNLATQFLSTVITETRHQLSAYKFLEQLLCLKSPAENYELLSTMNWNTIVEILKGEFSSQQHAKYYNNLISILTLIAIRNLADIESIIREHSTFITELQESGLSEEEQNQLTRLLYYTNMLDNNLT